MTDWMIKPIIQNCACPYALGTFKTKDKIKIVKCGSEGNHTHICTRSECPIKVPQNAVEYAKTLKW